MRRSLISLAVVIAAACGDDTPGSGPEFGTPIGFDASDRDAGLMPMRDGGFGPDVLTGGDASPDASTNSDAGAIDLSVRDDGGPSDADTPADASTPGDAAVPIDAGPMRLQLRVITFNTGTSGVATHDSPPDDGYTSTEAQITEDYYGHGLSWIPVMDDTRDFLAMTQPDIVAFQEIFFSGECATMPSAGGVSGFVCDGWTPSQPTVAAQILDANWQIACNLEKPDKCLAVRLAVGSFRGCNQSLCLNGLQGARVPDCGGGSRIGRGTIDLVDGSTLTVVNVHGSSGLTAEDQECRERQFEQVFDDLGLGDSEPAANGTRNLILGDFNTDPGRHTLFDSSARRLGDFVGGNHRFQFISEVGRNAPATYAGLFNIDHVISDHFVGSCWAAGITAPHPAVTSIEYFDHVPIVCEIEEP